MDVTVEGLLAPVAELHRSAGAQRQHAGVDLHVDVLTGAEGPSHAGEVQPDLVLGQAEARRDLLPVDVEPLRGHVEVHAAVLGWHRQSRLWPEGRLVLHRRLVVAVHPHVRPSRVGVAVDDVHVAQHIPEVVQPRGIGRERLLPCRRHRAAGSRSTAIRLTACLARSGVEAATTAIGSPE